MSYIIRKAVESDLQEILDHLKDFSEFYDNKYKLYGKDEDYNKKLILGFITNHVFFVAVTSDTNSIVGFISGLVNKHIYNPSILVLTESFWWVTKDHRNSRAGLLLLNQFVKLGKEIAQWVVMTVESKSPINERTLLKRDFKLIEKSYLLEV